MTEQDVIAPPTAEQMAGELRWMIQVNGEGVGLYGASIRKHGPVPQAEACVDAGFAERRDSDNRDERGYWITQAGRDALVRWRALT